MWGSYYEPRNDDKVPKIQKVERRYVRYLFVSRGRWHAEIEQDTVDLFHSYFEKSHFTIKLCTFIQYTLFYNGQVCN